MKQASLNLKINPDLKEAVKSIQGLGAAVGKVKIQAEIDTQKLKPIKVDVAFKGIGENLGTIAAQRFIGGISGVKVGFDVRQLEDAGDAISSKIAREISRSVGGGLRGGGILKALGGIAAAPLRVAQQAIASTVEGAIFGLTRELTTDLGKGIRQSIDAATGGTIGSTELLGRKASDALFSGIKEGGLNKIPGLIEAALSKNPRIAGIGRNLAQNFIDNFEQGLAGKTKQLQTAIASIVPEEERLTAAGARTQGQKKQTEFDRAQAQEAIFEQRRAVGRRIQQRGEEIPRQIANIDALVEAAKADETFSKETAKLKQRIQQLEKVDTANFSADKKNELKTEIAILKNRYAELLLPLTNAAKQRQELQKELEGLVKIRADITRQFNLVGSQDERRNALFEEGAQLEDKLKENNSKIAKQRNLLNKTKGLQQRISIALESAKDSEKAAIIEQINQSIAFSNSLNKSIALLDEEGKTLEKQLQRVYKEYKDIPAKAPKVVEEIAAQLAKNAGIKFDPKNLPQIAESTNATLLDRTQAAYDPGLNVIQVREDLFEALQQGLNLTPAQKRILAEEIAHSLQFDLGTLEGYKAFKQETPKQKIAQPTPEDALRLASELASYQASGKSRNIVNIEREAKVAADNFVNQAQSIEQQAEDLAALSQKYQQTGLKLRNFIEREAGSVQSKISELLPLAAERGDEAVAEVRHFQQLIETIQNDSAAAFKLIASAELGQAPTADIGKIRAELENNVRKIGQIEALVGEAEKGLKQKSGTLATVGQAASNIAETISPAGNIVLRGAEMAGGALGAVAKAGMALADKIGFAASSFIPGGALLYDPVIKPVAKTAAMGGALAAASATVPGAAEILGAITSTISTILAPATGGLAEGIGASVSADIVGALPHLFQSLSGAIAQSGLPGAGLTAQSVELVGGQLTHLLQPVVQGVASTADASIVAVGGAVQHFLADLGTILVAGKGVETGVKLATSPDARAAALQGIQTVGEGAGQFINAVPEAIDKAQTAVERTTQAVQRNIDEIKDAGQRVAQGEIQAVGDIVEASTEAAAHIARGASDVAKASTKAASDIVEGASKVGGVLGKLALQAIPGVEDLGDLGKDQLLNIYNQLTKKLETVVKAEIDALNETGSASTEQSGIIRGDLNKIQDVLQQKYQHTIDVLAQEITDEPLYLSSKVDLRQLEPVEVEIQSEEIEAARQELKKAQSKNDRFAISKAEGKLREAQKNAEFSKQALDVLPDPTDERNVFAEQIKLIDDSITATEQYIRQYYADLAKAAESYKKAIKKGAIEDAQKAQDAARTASQALFQEINETSRDLANVLESLAEIGIDLSPSEPIRDRIRKLNAEIESKRKLGTQRVAQAGLSVPTAQPDSLEAIDTTALQNSLDKGAQSLSGALKSLVETIFEVKGQTLKEALALAAKSPRGKDLAVNTVGLAGSIAAGTQGPVAGLAGDLIGALAARQAIGGGGPETFGDITGFLTGNLVNKITGVPGSGAAAAAAIVPQLQKLRDQLQAKYGQPIEIPIQFEGLEAIDLEYLKAQEQIKELDKLISNLQKLAKEGEAAKAKLDALPSNIKTEKPLIQLPNLTQEQQDAEARRIDGLRQLRLFQEAEAKKPQGVQPVEAYEEEWRLLSIVEKEMLETRQKSVSQLSAAEQQQLEEFDRRQKEFVSKINQSKQKDKLPKEIQSLLDRTDAAMQDLENQTETYIKELNKSASELAEKQQQRAARRRAEQQAAIDLADQKRLEEGERPEQTGRRFIVGPTGKVKEERFNRPGDIKTELQKANLEAKTILETTEGDIKPPDPKTLRDLTRKVRDAEIRFNLAAEALEDEILQLEAGGGAGGGRGGLLGRGIAGAGDPGGPGGPLNTLKNIGRGFREVAEAAGIPVGPISKLGGLLKGVGIAALAFVAVNSFGDAIVQAGRAAFDTAVNMERLQTKLNFIAGGPQAAGKDLEFLRGLSNELQLPLEGLVEGFTSLKTATKGTAIEGAATKESFAALATASKVLGVSNDDLKGQFLQLGQIFRKGRADTEDLNTIQERGLSIQQELEKQLGKSGVAFRKALENGEVTADKVAKALTALGQTVKGGLPAALQTASSKIDAFRKRIQDLSLAVGPAVLGGFSAVVSGVIAGIDRLESTGRKLEPVFGAIAEVGGIIVDIASPIVGALATINEAIRQDLLDGFIIPFQVIRAGLVEIRKTIQFTFGVIRAVLAPVAKAFKLLPDDINPVTIAIKAVGAAVAILAVTQFVQLVASIGLAIKSFFALRLAALSFTVTPVGAAIAAIGLAAVVAAPQVENLARKLSGLSEQELDKNDKNIEFAKEFNDALNKLRTGVPLTANEIEGLKKRFQEQVTAGRASNTEMERGVRVLDRMQASALAAAEIQGKLTAAMNASKKAVKEVSKEIDADYTTRETALNESLANQQITRDRFDAEELDAQQKKTQRYEALYDEQAKNLQAALSEAQARLATPMPSSVRGEVVKQVQEIEDQLNDIEKSRGQARIEYLKGVQKQNEKIESDRVKRSENTQKAIQTLADAGTRTQGEAEQEVSAIKEAELQRRIKTLNKQISEERNAAGKLTDIGKTLYSERIALEAELQKSIADRTGIRSKAEAELVDLEEKTQKSIQSLVQAGIATELQGEEEISRIKEAQIRRRIALINEELEKTTDTGAYNIILASRRELEAELTAVVAEGVSKRYDLLLKDVQQEQESLAAVLSEVEAKTLTDIQRLQNRGVIKQKQADMERLNLTKFRLQQELQAQQQYIVELQKLPDPTDPEKRREAENTLRDAKLKTAQLTQQLAEQEYQQQEKIREIAIDAIDERIKGQENLAKAGEEFAGVATRALENQNKLLEAQKSLKQSMASYDDQAYKILIDTEKSETEKAKLQELAAAARLRGLKETQAIERDILELQIEQERVANRVATVKAAAALEQAKAEEEKVALNPEATATQKRAASLTTFAAEQELAAKILTGQLQDRGFQSRRAQAEIDDNRESLAARFELANARTDKSQKEEEIERLREGARRGIGLNRARRAIDGALPQVDLHSGAIANIQKLGDLNGELKQLRNLTSSGVVGNLMQLVNLQKNLSVQLHSIASSPKIVQNISNATPIRSRVLAGSKG